MKQGHLSLYQASALVTVWSKGTCDCTMSLLCERMSIIHS